MTRPYSSFKQVPFTWFCVPPLPKQNWDWFKSFMAKYEMTAGETFQAAVLALNSLCVERETERIQHIVEKVKAR